MQCEEYLSLLSAHLDGALTEQEEATLQAHLSRCAHCRAILEQLQEQQSALEQIPPMPERVHAAAMQRVRASRRKGTPRRWLPAVAGAAAAAAMLTLVASGVLPLPHDRQTRDDKAAQPETAALREPNEAEKSAVFIDTGEEPSLPAPEAVTGVDLTPTPYAQLDRNTEQASLVLEEPLPQDVAALLQTCEPTEDAALWQAVWPELSHEEAWRCYRLDSTEYARLRDLLDASGLEPLDEQPGETDDVLVLVLAQP